MGVNGIEYYEKALSEFDDYVRAINDKKNKGIMQDGYLINLNKYKELKQSIKNYKNNIQNKNINLLVSEKTDNLLN